MRRPFSRVTGSPPRPLVVWGVNSASRSVIELTPNDRTAAALNVSSGGMSPRTAPNGLPLAVMVTASTSVSSRSAGVVGRWAAGAVAWGAVVTRAEGRAGWAGVCATGAAAVGGAAS